MNWTHPPEDLLFAFSGGEVSDDDAVAVARHLDACPACAGRAVALDPMAHVFASVDDVAIPDDLVALVETAALAPERAGPGRTELLVAAALLASGAAIMLSLGSPGELIVGGVAVVGALAATGASLAATVGSPVATATFLAGVGLAASLVTVQRRAGRRAA